MPEDVSRLMHFSALRCTKLAGIFIQPPKPHLANRREIEPFLDVVLKEFHC